MGGIAALVVSLVGLALFGGLASSASGAATYVVNSTADPGSGTCDASECTLREAIAAANAAPGADSIHFSIPGPGPYTIQPTSALPTITDPVTIDGTTQTGFAGSPIIEISGELAPVDSAGIRITAGSSTVRGLVINRFVHGAVNFNGPDGQAISLEGLGGNAVYGNYLGTDVTGTVDLGNHTGVMVNSSNNTIGGALPAARNVIGGNNRYAVYVVNPMSINNTIEGNYVGLTPSGSATVPNLAAINFNGAGQNTVRANVISGNAGGAVITVGGNSNVIDDNLIGTDGAGNPGPGFGNGFGVQIFSASSNVLTDNLIAGSVSSIGVLVNSTIAANVATNNVIQGNEIIGHASGVAISGVTGHNGNQIGGTAAGEGNVIAFNTGPGVSIENGDVRNSVLSNSIHDNGGLGIDLSPVGPTPNDVGDVDTGANDLQNFPVLTSVSTNAGNTNVTGTLSSQPNTDYRLEFFANDECDPSGFGEGETFLGAGTVTTDAAGDANFTFTFANPGGSFITATATDPLNNTSELSECTESEDAAATLIVIKHVINDNGGTAEADDFTLDSGGTDDTPDDFPGAEAPGTAVSMSPGSYNVTETGPSGYTASYSADCAGSIASRRDEDLHGHQRRHPAGRQPDHVRRNDLR